jgi:hypothetical protein
MVLSYLVMFSPNPSKKCLLIQHTRGKYVRDQYDLFIDT